MSRGVGTRSVATALACAAIGGCAVHNPTDLAQRRPVIPAATSSTDAGAAQSFNSRAASLLLVRLGYGRPRNHGIPPGPLRAFVAPCRGTTKGCFNIFFFYGDRYVGAAFARPPRQLGLRGQDGRLVRALVPGPSGGYRYVRYVWDGQTVIGLSKTGKETLVRTPSHQSS
jgi:hypothetical protein